MKNIKWNLLEQIVNEYEIMKQNRQLKKKKYEDTENCIQLSVVLFSLFTILFLLMFFGIEHVNGKDSM